MKKISYKDFAYLMNYKKHHPFIKYCCNCYLKERDSSVLLTSRVKLPIYILLFIPAQIIELFYAAWDCGIRNYDMWGRTITSFTRFTIYDNIYKEWKEQSGM